MEPLTEDKAAASQPTRLRGARRLVLYLVAGSLGLCLLAVLVSALSNLGLPTQSSVVDRLTEAEKARLAEVTHLRQTLGDAVWPGWAEADIPLIVYNEAYVFLVGLPDPAPGWLKVPQRSAQGTAWEVVPGDTFQGQPYYRQRLGDPPVTPQAFTVLVGERWVASFQTREYAQISMVSGLREQLSPVVRSVVPYRLVWGLLMGESEGQILALAHEAFHAYQGQAAWERFTLAEGVMALEGRYPWDAAKAAWGTEVSLLSRAARAGTEAEARDLARQFLAQRDQRRAAAALGDDLIDFERQREWLEGLAKYAELALGRAAATTPGYAPVQALGADPEFHQYRSRARFWEQQLGEAGRLAGHEGEVRFYYTGLAQAAVLDRLAPGWKAEAFNSGVWLEDLLRQAVGP